MLAHTAVANEATKANQEPCLPGIRTVRLQWERPGKCPRNGTRGVWRVARGENRFLVRGNPIHDVRSREAEKPRLLAVKSLYAVPFSFWPMIQIVDAPFSVERSRHVVWVDL